MKEIIATSPERKERKERKQIIGGRKKANNDPPLLYDRLFLLAALSLIALGLLMVTSASMVISERVYGQPFHYLIRQAIYLGMGFLLSLWVIRMPIATWQRSSVWLLLLSLLLLIVVLIPGIGRTVNGSMRWIDLGIARFQVSEFVKLGVIVYLSGYLVRHQESVKKELGGFLRPFMLLGVIAGLLLKEPDFGASVVIMMTAMGMFFLAGVRLWQFIAVLALVMLMVAILAVSSPYRLERLTTFLNPWANPYTGGYQLTQALIAFGRGGWSGVGLGESVQKLFYLPEAHTDFLFAVLVEELGLTGALVVILLIVTVVLRAFRIARHALLVKNLFSGYLAYGLALWFGIQAFINIGVSSGVLPTKGLTLPLMSSGGSSMLMNCIAIALLLRIDHETRWNQLGMTETT